MTKRVFLLSAMTVVLVAISSLLGYATAYIQGVQKMNEMMVNNYCDVLRLQSLTLARNLESLTVAGLIEAVQLNCDSMASFVSVNQPYSPPGTQKRIAEALKAWQKAQEQLREIRALHTDENRPQVMTTPGRSRRISSDPSL